MVIASTENKNSFFLTYTVSGQLTDNHSGKKIFDPNLKMHQTA